MRDYQKELADSLDKSDQITKLEAKVDELQRQLAERDKDCEALNSVMRDKGWGQGEIDSVTDLWEQNEVLQRRLAEREAVIERLREALKAMINSARGMNCGLRIADEAIVISTDHTALYEAIKQAKVDALEEAGNHYERQMFDHIAAGLRRMADEIRSNT